MKLKKMYGVVIFGMVVLLIITVLLLARVNSLTNRSRKLNQDGIKLITLSNDMLHANDYLIKLMRVFVVTGDVEFLDKYKTLITYDNLQGKLDEMVKIGLSKEEIPYLDVMHEMLDRLERIENLAIEAYEDGDIAAAESIIFSDVYIGADLLLSQNTTDLLSMITERINGGVSEIQGRLRVMEALMNTIMTLSIACFIAIQLRQRNRVLKPIVEIENIMRDISDGNVDGRLVKKYDDEIGSLFDHVNDMSESIEAYMEESDNSLDILKNILNGIDAFVYVTDPETDIILFVNEKMEKHFGILDGAVGQYCYNVLQPGVGQRCDFCPCIKLDENPEHAVVWEERNANTNRDYRNTDCYIEWLGGIKVHLQHKVDITDMKTYMNDKLLAEREALEMKHEKEKAEASARAKNDFLAKMSHEIRTPMNAVMGMSEIILRNSPPQDIYENVLGIKNASLNLLSIINDILDFSKIESGKMEIVEANYQFASLINDVISIIRIRIIDKPIQFVVSIAPNIPATLKGDEIRIRQTLLNILSNAVKYTNEGYIKLAVKGDIRGNSVLLTMDVEDSGIGVKAEDVDKLFGDFVQIDTVKNKGIEGTGLGLAISRSLCRMMGGDISLKSEYGVGSTFTITLTQCFDTYAPFASVEEPAKKSILIYETRELYRDSLVEALKSLGVKYECTQSVPELFDKLEGFGYVFVSSFMYGSIYPALSKLEKPPKLVLLSDVTETFATKAARTLVMPAHALSVANVLNDVYEDQGTLGAGGASFTAPDVKVLVVDDVAANLKVCEGLMVPYEMQVTLCQSARESLELIAENRYDLVFMDHMMPEMDGIEVACAVREMEGEYFKTLPIIALTANAVSGVREMFVQNGMNDFLSKPIETNKLDAILEKWIPKERRGQIVVREAEEESEFVGKLRTVRELSVDKALEVVGGSFQTYERVVKLSARLLPDNINRLNMLIVGDLAGYAIEVHGIKGVLNNLGAYGLGEMAYELERYSKDGDFETCAGLHPGFIDGLKAFSDTMQELLEPNDATTKVAGEFSAIMELLPELEEAADYFDNVAALKLISSLEKYTYGSAIDGLIAELTAAFESFEFEKAMDLLEQLKGGLLEWARWNSIL